MLKADFHIHTSEDPKDSWINYNARELIDIASSKGYDVLSITPHCHMGYGKELVSYAKKKGILLILGLEAKLEGKDVIILNASLDANNLRDFIDLEKYRRKNPQSFIMAPHPFYPREYSLRGHFKKYLHLFDGVEYSHCYLNFINIFNNKMEKYARKKGIPIIGTSDAHQLFQFSHTYSLVDSKKDINSVIKALKEGKVQIRSKPLSFLNFLKVFYVPFKKKMFR